MKVEPDSLLVQAIEAVPSPLALMHSVRDESGTIVDFEWDYINAAGAQEILVKQEELVGQRLLVKLPEHKNGLFELYAKVAETGEPFVLTEAGYDDTWGTQDVIPRIYDIRSTRFGDGICIWWNDVTDRVAARVKLENRALAAKITELTAANAPVGQALVSREGEFRSVNPAFCRISGRSEADLLGRTFQAITHPDDLDADVQQATALAERKIDRYVMEKRYIKSNGAAVWIRLHASAVWDGDDFVTYIAQIADIDSEVGLRQSLEARNRDLQQFAYVASHDLQAPIRTISAYFDLLTDSLNPADMSTDQVDHIDEIHQAIGHMRELTSDLLALSRVNRPTEEEPICSVNDAVAASIASISADLATAECEVSVDVEPDLIVQVNPTHMKQILTNLLSNSLKYCNPARSLELGLSGRTVGDRVVIRVQDNGIGIPPGAEDRAFQMFQRLQTGGQGTGIGLAIVRSLAERYGGSARIDSDGKSGTTVTITLMRAYR